MNTLRSQISKKSLKSLWGFWNAHKCKIFVPNIFYYATTIDHVDIFASELQKYKTIPKSSTCDISNLYSRHFMETESQKYDVSKMNVDDLDKILLELQSKGKDKQVHNVVLDCMNIRKFIGELTLKKLFRYYSNVGKTEMVIILQKYCAKVDPNFHKRNGEFQHYLAKALCFKGNSEKGLELLKLSYKRFEGLRTFYRIVFRELIQDSVLNRSEATLVIFKRYVLDFSKSWDEHYPLICFWHICWSSSWFSDQVLADHLLEDSETLQDIIRDKSTAFSISILKEDNNEDAVIRLIQTLLKYKMMSEYVKVLQVLFNFKLRNRDIRGCTEIIRNCEVLGVTLPADQQGRYIQMLIEGKRPDKQPIEKPTSKHFKLKF